MLSKPPDWKFTKKNILSEISQDGERSLQAAVYKLKDAGYLKITRGNRKKGKLAESIWTVYDTPQLQNAVMEKTESQKEKCSSPQLRYPAVQNAVDYKRNNNKIENAVPAMMGGVQLGGEYYYQDPKTGGYVRKENP